MTAAAETGRAGERAATEYLRRAGYEICALNWRQGRYELDIVACREGVLHFVEVKTRRADGLTTPEEALTPRKFAALRRAVTDIYQVEARPVGIGGATVAALLRQQGLPAAVWSCIDSTCHQPDEHSSITATLKDAQVFAHVLMQR